jgi:ComF family protein
VSRGPLEYAIVPLSYDFPIDVAIKALKFRRRLYYASAMAEILCAACEQLPRDIDAVVPVPLHWRRKAMRGFNQAMELAAPVAKHLNLPLVRGVFRQRATPFQTGLGASERERNLRQAFGVRGACEFAHILIVDDVITTGATTDSLARTLLANGAGRVSAMALARAR